LFALAADVSFIALAEMFLFLFAADVRFIGLDSLTFTAERPRTLNRAPSPPLPRRGREVRECTAPLTSGRRA
jgi:hypothetical protein